MNNSISVILPVRNAQSTLFQYVDKTLEVLSELANRFELLIIDDASTDRTEEIAYEIQRKYPQVRLIRHHMESGRRAAVQSGLNQATSEIILIEDDPEVFCAKRRLLTSDLYDGADVSVPTVILDPTKGLTRLSEIF